MFSLRSIARTPIALRAASARPLSISSRFAFPRKDTQDKDSINTESTEYSKTGGDQQSAHSKAAFDPNTTDPDQQVNEAEGGGNPLDGSPGNSQVNQHKTQETSKSSKSAGPTQQSGEYSSGGKSTGKKVS